MENIIIGDFVCLHNHPYFDDYQKIKIAANAEMTPPIMVVAETLDKDDFDPLTGKQFAPQIKCFYYSSKEGKYIDKWFKASQLKKLIQENTYLDNDVLKKIEDYDLEYLKDIFLNKMVCLKSVDFELNKRKIFFDSSDGIRTNKENNHLDFLPPVMTVIDIIKNKEEKKFSIKEKDKLEKDLSKYIFKCKWYNSKNSSYSEEFIPSTILGIVKEQNDLLRIIKDSIDSKMHMVIKLNNNAFKLEDGTAEVVNTIIKPVELLLNHYYYKLNATNYLKQKTISYALDELLYENNKEFYSIYLTDKRLIFGKKLPRFKTNFQPITADIFTEGEYYIISYCDKNNKITNRCIKVMFKEPYTDLQNDKELMFIVSNCLLRNGKIRHFNLDQIIRVTEILNGLKIFEGNEVEDIL